MWKQYKTVILTAALLAVTAISSFAGEAELLAVLQSDDGSPHAKSEACRELARIGTEKSVPTLVALLGDEKLAHMARMALEPNSDPRVDEAFRAALDSSLRGRPLLGVIGSVGVRRDAKAVDALVGLLNKAEYAPAAARALGNIGTPEAAKGLQGALAGASGETQKAVCEGLLRCAEALTADGKKETAQAIYDSLRGLADAPPQVCAAGLRGAILSRGKDGIPLLVKALHGSDDALVAAAVRSAMELPGSEVGDALVAELPKLPANRRGLVIGVLAKRGDSRVLPAVLEAAQSDDKELRILAFRALKRVGDASCVPALLDAAVNGSAEVSAAAMEALDNLQGKSVDEQVAKQLADAKGKIRLVLMDLATRRRTAAAAPTLWKAADDEDAAVRVAALAGLGAVLDAADLPKLIARLATTKDTTEAAALDKAIQAVCLRSEDQEAAAAKLAEAIPSADGPVKARILETLNIVGGAGALKAVAAAAKSDDKDLCDAASRVLGKWKSIDAAPVLLDLHNSTDDGRLKVRAIRAYIRIARQFNMPAKDRAEMCRTALKTAERDADKSLVLEVLLRYPDDEMQAIAKEAAEIPALKDQANLIVAGMAAKGINRAELGRALAQAGQKPVKLEIVKAVYGAGDKTKDVTKALRKYAKNYRIIFLPNTSYNESFGGDPAQGIQKQLKIKYRIDGKDGEATFGENATIVLPEVK